MNDKQRALSLYCDLRLGIIGDEPLSAKAAQRKVSERYGSKTGRLAAEAGEHREVEVVREFRREALAEGRS